MSYRSIKRVFGETSIERKCRLLFLASLVLLIVGAFTLVSQVSRSLVIKTTRGKARDLFDILLLRTHFEKWDTSNADDWVHNVARDFFRADYEYELIAPDDGSKLALIPDRIPENPAEAAIVRDLKSRYDDYLREQQRVAQLDSARLSADADATKLSPSMLPSTVNTPANSPVNSPAAKLRDVVFFEERLPERDEYRYFAPIVWQKTCLNCHQTLVTTGAISASDSAATQEQQIPFRVVKLVLPYKSTQDAITQVNAILWTVGIVTVFVAMIVLYIIVRYVVVKPLKHLRDVSDDISRGHLETRAEIRTGDEFQELADSFNRMLRHLTETQHNLRQVNGELDAKVDELAQLNMRLYDMNRLKGDFLANMSHELRTPLNSIIGFSEVLQGIDTLNDKQKRYAQNIQKSGRLLLEMINDILDLAKVEAGRMEVRPTEFSIETIVQAQCDLVRQMSEEKNIDVLVDVTPDLPLVFQDQGKIQQILTNLLSNAIKFTPEGGRILVTGRADSQGRLELQVSDTGVGIAPEDREIIFEKFRQGQIVVGDDGLTRRFSGTGLGLSIVRELCKLLGGEITVASELGKGSTFTVVLPWYRNEPSRSDLPRSDALPLPSGTPS